MTSATPSLSTDIADDPDYVESLANAKAQMAVPIISGKDTLGVVFVETDQNAEVVLAGDEHPYPLG